MYNTKVICTYNTSSVFLPTDNISDDDEEFIRDAIYRQELLDILDITEFNETEMMKALHELYEKIESFEELKECMKIMAGKIMSEDLELGLMMLFAYDYMYLTHICICEYLENPPLENPPLENPPLGKVEPNSAKIKQLIKLISR